MRNENGYGCISKLSGKRRRPYVVKITTGYRVEGGRAKQIQKAIGYFSTKKEAALFLAEYNTGKAPEQISKPPMTWEQVYNEWYKWKESQMKAPSWETFRKYDTMYKKTDRLASRRFVDIRAADLQEIMDAGKDLSKDPQVKLMQIMKGMYKWAIDHDVCTTDYSARVVLQYSEGQVRDHKPFTDEEIRKLIEADAALPLLLIFTGMRIGELITLRADQIHDGYIIGGLKTAAGRDRFIPIADAVKPYVQFRGPSYYYETRQGRTYSTSNFTSQIWKPLMESLGMEHLPHDTRHTCATLMERAGIDLLHRKLILGHAVEDITEGRYTHVKREALSQDMEKVASLFF